MPSVTKKLLPLCLLAAIASPSWAITTVSYNTTGSALSCAAAAGCFQNNSSSVTLGGITLIYNAGSGSNVAAPSYINLGNLVTTGTGNNVSLAGLQLTINVNSTPPGASGVLPVATFGGTISTSQSLATLTFAAANTTTANFGTLPGVQISGATGSFIYQVTQSVLTLNAPTVGNPVGEISLQGGVSAVPEPASAALMLLGVAGLLAARRRQD